jgi:Ran GTPase-activating protein (RanGAP) involved in mRNA processing and transport
MEALPPDFDYHLTLKEQDQLEQIVPMNQANIHLGFRALVLIDSAPYPDSAVALSEHLVTLCGRTFLGHNLKLLLTFHLLSIRSMATVDDATVQIMLQESEVVIATPVCMRFARNLIRNYLLGNPMLPPPLRFRFSCHDASHFPLFEPGLSPSQNFQFTYNSNCSYYDVTYHHDVARYFHQQLVTCNGFFDLNQLPIHLLEAGLGDAADIKAITSSLAFCPYVYGLNCENIVRHDIVQASACLLLFNSNIRILRLVKVGAEDGCKELATALYGNLESTVLYWDLSHNHLGDISHLLQAFGLYRVPVRSFRFTNCTMEAFDLSIFLKSLLGNPDLRGVSDLCLGGNKLGPGHCEQLAEFVGDWADCLRVLEFGPASRADQVLAAIDQPLESLAVWDSTLSDGSLVGLVEASECLRHIDLSGCNIADKLLLDFLGSLAANDKLTDLTLVLNRLKLRGARLAQVFSIFNDNEQLAPKVRELSLGENGLALRDLEFLLPILQAAPRLAKVSLAGNFGARMTGIGAELARLLQVSHIESLCLRDCRLGEQVASVISALFTNNTLRELDIRNNQIRNEGLRRLTNLLRTNSVLEVLSVDQSAVDSAEVLFNFLDVVAQSRSLVQVPYPLDDVYEMLAAMDEEPRLRAFDVLTHLQALAERALATNRASRGMFSGLTLLRDSVLDELFDGITVDLLGKLRGLKLNEHRAIAEVVGLPFPWEEDTGVVADAEDVPEAEPYVSRGMMRTVSEPGEISAGMLTLQFNSLLIRRPDAQERLRKKGMVLAVMPDEELPKPSKLEEVEMSADSEDSLAMNLSADRASQ